MTKMSLNLRAFVSYYALLLLYCITPIFFFILLRSYVYIYGAKALGFYVCYSLALNNKRILNAKGFLCPYMLNFIFIIIP